MIVLQGLHYVSSSFTATMIGAAIYAYSFVELAGDPNGCSLIAWHAAVPSTQAVYDAIRQIHSKSF